jgi:hypothetical protein
MIRKTYSILAIAFTTSACAGAVSSTEREPTKEELAQELSRAPIEDALKNREHFAPLCDGEGYPLPGNMNRKGGPSKLSQICAPPQPQPPQPSSKGKAAPAPSNTEAKPAAAPSNSDAKPVPPPPPAPACDQTALNQELATMLLDNALAKTEHFRCLCDDQGYPLVGNINAKGASASAFCGALREKGKQ